MKSDMNIVRLCRLVALLICTSGISTANAQKSAFGVISQYKHMSASNFCIYPDTALAPLTPPPPGKHPFYISHYGRHGSRYISNRKGYDIPYKMLAKADSLDELTPIGQDAFAELKRIIEDTEGRWGDLTDIGKRQHRDIARRMAQNFPEVFEGQAYVDARSTIVNRCVLSMGSAIQELTRHNPQLRINMTASQSTMWYMNHQDKLLRSQMMPKEAQSAYDDFCIPLDLNPRLMELLFVDSAYVSKNVDEKWLSYYLLKAGLMQQNTRKGYLSPLTDLYSYEDIHRFWLKENAWWYINYGFSPLSGGCQPYTQRYLLRQIIQDADSCLRLKGHGATLRFGHETVVLPLVCLLGINGFDLHTDDLAQLEPMGWWACLVFPMASNIQFVFYREGPYDKDILFKVLLNEQEATLPIPTDMAPYYHWRDFRDHYLKLFDAYEQQRAKQ
ncbi:MAG: histidine-type phosphatase [Prevotella sp.]|nr:histidine-type phosphatase [Prevotella sp.]